MRTDSRNRNTAADYQRSHEPIAWSLFGAGGMVVAFITPALVIISGLLLPAGLSIDYSMLLALLQSVWGKLAIFTIISLQLFHAAHRLHHSLHDLHIEGRPMLQLWVFYGGATALSLLALALLIKLGW